MSELTELTERVSALECALYGSKTVRGWDAAARVLDLTAPTVKRLFQADTKFPKPSRVKMLGANRIRPEWPLSSLLNYKTSK